jgi:hypothetical protein
VAHHRDRLAAEGRHLKRADDDIEGPQPVGRRSHQRYSAAVGSKSMRGPGARSSGPVTWATVDRLFPYRLRNIGNP